MYGCVGSFGLEGITAFRVKVECDKHSGLPGFDVVGLPDASVKESRDRVISAIKNSGIVLSSGKTIVNLAPADKRKAGTIYDLPILVSILCANGIIESDTSDIGFLGELSLDGMLCRVNGVLPMILDAKKLGYKQVIIPFDNAAEGKIAKDIDVFAAKSIEEVINHLNKKHMLENCKNIPTDIQNAQANLLDMADVKGQEGAKRALTIAAGGLHNILLIGSPGTGKSMLAKRISGILPEMSLEEQIETTKIYSAAGLLPSGIGMITKRPYRSPHHTVSSAGLCGGGSTPQPGDVSLAHNGVLFLDEFPEFSRLSMETLRQPLEDGFVTISRASGRVTFPSRIMLVAAMNPCPCGFLGHPDKKCTCRPDEIKRYLGRISGPLLDRIDLHIEVPPVKFNELSDNIKTESTKEMLEKVKRSFAIQQNRFKGSGIYSNSCMTRGMIEKYCVLTNDAKATIKLAFDSLGLSARGYDRLLRVARTIADLENEEVINECHISEAISYRLLDRKYWSR